MSDIDTVILVSYYCDRLNWIWLVLSWESPISNIKGTETTTKAVLSRK